MPEVLSPSLQCSGCCLRLVVFAGLSSCVERAGWVCGGMLLWTKESRKLALSSGSRKSLVKPAFDSIPLRSGDELLAALCTRSSKLQVTSFGFSLTSFTFSCESLRLTRLIGDLETLALVGVVSFRVRAALGVLALATKAACMRAEREGGLAVCAEGFTALNDISSGSVLVCNFEIRLSQY